MSDRDSRIQGKNFRAREAEVADAYGISSAMVKIPLFYCDDVIDGADHQPHPMFLCDGKTYSQVYISKYQNTTIDAAAYSRAAVDPVSAISFDDAVCACKAKGKGWHLMTNAEWAGVALLSQTGKTMPRGNTLYGCAYQARHERGKVTYRYQYEGKIYDGRVACGSGPVTWSHDQTVSGIYDMTGNIWEWVSGIRVLDGELQIIENNDAAGNTADLSKQSKLWKRISAKGELTDSKTEETLHFHCHDASCEIQAKPHTALSGAICQTGKARVYRFAENRASYILKILKLYGLSSTDSKDTSHMYVRDTGERLAFRGGDWDTADRAGIFSLAMIYERYREGFMGFRSAYLSEDDVLKEADTGFVFPDY